MCLETIQQTNHNHNTHATQPATKTTMATIVGSRAAPSADISASHPYTCNTCQVAFRNSDLQRGHMRGDWQ